MGNREIDRKIQAFLFPWDESKCRTCGWTLAEFPACTLTDCSLAPSPCHPADEPAGFSTSLDAAMGAYQEFRTRGWRLIYLCDLGPSWGATLRREADGTEVIRAEITPAMTICKAILAAAGLSDASVVTEAGTAVKKEASNLMTLEGK